MFVEFESMPDSSRVWLYQTNRKLTEAESETAKQFLKDSINSWVTHGMPMKGSFSLLHDRILLIAADVDFQSPSGCSIDSSTRWLKDLGASLGVDFFDRSIGYFDGSELQFFSFFEAKKNVQSGVLKADTQIVNHQIATMADVKNGFTVSAAESFLKRHFAAEVVSQV
jgi:hypothetical protein